MGINKSRVIGMVMGLLMGLGALPIGMNLAWASASDSLLQLLNSDQYKGHRSDLYLALAKENRSDSSILFHYLEEGLKAARIEKTPKTEALLVYEKGNANKRLYHFPEALKYYLQAARLFQKLENTTKYSLCMHQVATVYDKMGRYEQAIKYCTKSVALDSSVNDLLGVSIGLNNIGNYHLSVNRTSKALKSYRQSYRIKQQLRDTLGMASLLNNIGLIYSELKDYQKALNSYHEGIQICKKNNLIKEQSTYYNNLGKTHALLKNRDSAYYYNQASLSLSRKYDNESGMIHCYINLSDLATSEKNYHEALNYLNQAFEMVLKTHQEPYYALIYLGLGQVYQALGQNQTAIQNYQYAYQYAAQYKQPEYLQLSIKNLGKVYELTGNYKTANKYLKQEYAITDSLNQKKNIRETAEIESQYQIDKIKSEYYQEYHQQELDLIKQKSFNHNLALFILFLLVVVAGSLIVNYQAQKRTRMLAKKQDELKTALSETQTIFENSLVGLVHVNQDRKIIKINHHFCDMIGYSEDEVIGQSLNMLYPSNEALREIKLMYEQLYRKGKVTHQIKAITKSGVPLFLKASGKIINKADPTKGIIWVLENISKQKANTEQLKRFQNFVEASGQGLAISLPDETVIYKNPALIKMLGAKLDTSTTTTKISSSYDEYHQKKLKEEVFPLVFSKGRWTGEMEQYTREGKKLQTLENYFLIRDDAGKPQYISAIISNISHQKNIEAQLTAANASKDQLFSIIAHDLKGPVGTLKSMLELIIEEWDDFSKEEAHLMLMNLKNSSQSAYYLLNNLLMWARSQRGSIQFNPTSIHLDELMDQLQSLFHQTAQNKSIHLDFEYKPNMMLHADSEILQTVLRNLLSNALKFTPNNGRIRLLVEIHSDHYQFMVIDSGVGMPKEIQERVFDPNKHYTSFGTNHEKGTGLGLKLCAQFVHLHGGKIGIESVVNQGTKIYFTISKA